MEMLICLWVSGGQGSPQCTLLPAIASEPGVTPPIPPTPPNWYQRCRLCKETSSLRRGMGTGGAVAVP